MIHSLVVWYEPHKKINSQHFQWMLCVALIRLSDTVQGYCGQSGWRRFHWQPVYHGHTPDSLPMGRDSSRNPAGPSSVRQKAPVGTDTTGTGSADSSSNQTVGDTATAGQSISMAQQHGTDTSLSWRSGQQWVPASRGAGKSRHTQPSGPCLVSTTQLGHVSVMVSAHLQSTSVCSVSTGDGHSRRTGLTVQQQCATWCEQWVDIRWFLLYVR